VSPCRGDSHAVGATFRLANSWPGMKRFMKKEICVISLKVPVHLITQHDSMNPAHIKTIRKFD
jgi:hypothetical protein